MTDLKNDSSRDGKPAAARMDTAAPMVFRPAPAARDRALAPHTHATPQAPLPKPRFVGPMSHWGINE